MSTANKPRCAHQTDGPACGLHTVQCSNSSRRERGMAAAVEVAVRTAAAVGPPPRTHRPSLPPEAVRRVAVKGSGVLCR